MQYILTIIFVLFVSACGKEKASIPSDSDLSKANANSDTNANNNGQGNGKTGKTNTVTATPTPTPSASPTPTPTPTPDPHSPVTCVIRGPLQGVCNNVMMNTALMFPGCTIYGLSALDNCLTATQRCTGQANTVTQVCGNVIESNNTLGN